MAEVETATEHSRKLNLLRKQAAEKEENSISVNSDALPARGKVKSRKSSPGLTSLYTLFYLIINQNRKKLN